LVFLGVEKDWYISVLKKRQLFSKNK